MRDKLKLAFLIVVVILIGVFLGYLAKEEGKKPIPTPPSKVSVPTLSVVYLPSDHHSALFVMAEYPEKFKEKGIYLKKVVDKEKYELYSDNKKIANIKTILAKKGGAEAMTLMAQERSDINLNGVPPTIFFIDKGTRAKIIAPLQNEGSAVVVAKDNPANNWGEFVSWIKNHEGKEKIGFPLVTSIQKVMLESALKASGITYSENPGEDTDVTIIDMKGQGTMLASLEKKEIDAVIAWQPTPAIMIEKGTGKIISFSQDLPPEEVWKSHPCCVLVASEKALKEKREIVKNFLKLTLLSTKLIDEEPDLAVKASSKWLGVEEKIEKSSIPTIKFSNEPTEKWYNGVYTFVREMDKLGKLEGRLKGKETQKEIKNVLFDFSLYQGAKKELGL